MESLERLRLLSEELPSGERFGTFSLEPEPLTTRGVGLEIEFSAQ